MEDKLEYNQEFKSDDGLTWELRKTSVLSFDTQTSSFSASQDHLLKYIPEKENRTQRHIIPATLLEKLSYFRCCVSTPSPSVFIPSFHFSNSSIISLLSSDNYSAFTSGGLAMQGLSIMYVIVKAVSFYKVMLHGTGMLSKATVTVEFLWYHILNVFFKSVPLTFVYIFLASYAPDEHFFMTKMVPICYGFSVAYVIAAIIDISACLKTVVMLLDYAICGLMFKNPWNRCQSAYFSDLPDNGTIYCYSLKDFIKKLENDTAYFNVSTYVTTYGEHFQSAPVVYYRRRVESLDNQMFFGTLKLLYFLIIWIIICLHYKQLFKRYIWKMLNNLHNIVNGIYLLVFIHLALNYFQAEPNNVAEIRPLYDLDLQSLLLTADIDMLAESMTTPPAIHILTARSTTEIKPTHDSAVIIISNAIYCIFRGFISYRVKTYCESFVKSPIYFTVFNQDSFFYFWPIYFSTFFFGDFFSIIFFTSHFLMELSTLIVTFQCLVEAIVCEWRLAKRVIVTIILLLVGLMWLWISSLHVRIVFNIYTKSLVTLLEVVGIYFLYPIGRLIDDITFYSGVPTKMRILNLRQFPIFYGVKLWTMLDALFVIAYKTEPNNDFIFDYFYASVGVMSVPVVFGALYSAYVYIWKKKRGFTSLFRPDDAWGPPLAVRELRKQYNSREFVGSQAPRMLSRYMIQKAESKVYKLDLRYDTYSARKSNL